MTNLQAALGLAQLERLEAFVHKDRTMGKRYAELLSGLTELQLPLHYTDYEVNIYWVYSIVLGEKSRYNAIKMMKLLAEEIIGTRPFSGTMHLQPVFQKMGFLKVKPLQFMNVLLIAICIYPVAYLLQ
jgi:perosamine synthetase